MLKTDSGQASFNSEAVDYNVLRKKKRTNANKNHGQPTQQTFNKCEYNVYENKKQHLAAFEKNLSNELLHECREAQSIRP